MPLRFLEFSVSSLLMTACLALGRWTDAHFHSNYPVTEPFAAVLCAFFFLHAVPGLLANKEEKKE